MLLDHAGQVPRLGVLVGQEAVEAEQVPRGDERQRVLGHGEGHHRHHGRPREVHLQVGLLREVLRELPSHARAAPQLEVLQRVAVAERRDVPRHAFNSVESRWEAMERKIREAIRKIRWFVRNESNTEHFCRAWIRTKYTCKSNDQIDSDSKQRMAPTDAP